MRAMSVAVFGIVVFVIGAVAMTPGGARLSMRLNNAPLNDGQGYKPKTVTGTRVMGAVLALAGIIIFIIGVA